MYAEYTYQVKSFIYEIQLLLLVESTRQSLRTKYLNF